MGMSSLQFRQDVRIEKIQLVIVSIDGCPDIVQAALSHSMARFDGGASDMRGQDDIIKGSQVFLRVYG